MINKTGLADYKPWICPVGVRLSDTRRRVVPAPMDDEPEPAVLTGKSQAAIIRNMIRQDFRPVEIRETLGCTYQTIAKWRKVLAYNG